MPLLDKDLFGEGPTPWHALKELALAAHALRGRGDGMERAEGEVQIRLMHVGVTSLSQGTWVAEAKWRVSA